MGGPTRLIGLIELCLLEEAVSEGRAMVRGTEDLVAHQGDPQVALRVRGSLGPLAVHTLGTSLGQKSA